MCNRVCLTCGKFICDRGNRALRCKKCQISHRKLQVKFHNQKQNSIIKSARATKERYAYYKMLKNLTLDELRVLFFTTKKKLKGVENFAEWRELRTYLSIIKSVYHTKKEVEDGLAQTIM